MTRTTSARSPPSRCGTSPAGRSPRRGRAPTGIRLAADGGFDAILLDVMMPDLDGEATARRLREDERTGAVPIVLLSAVPSLPDWATSLGISALVAKPFDPAGLPGAIREALHW